MNYRTAGAILLVIGVVALFAAIVGGGLKVRDIEVGSVPSKWRQGMLAVFGMVVALIGLVMWADDDGTAADSNTPATVTNAPAETVDANAVDANAGDANAAGVPPDDPNQAAPVEENTPTE